MRTKGILVKIELTLSVVVCILLTPNKLTHQLDVQGPNIFLRYGIHRGPSPKYGNIFTANSKIRPYAGIILKNLRKISVIITILVTDEWHEHYFDKICTRSVSKVSSHILLSHNW